MHRAMRRLDALEKLAAIDIALCGNDGLAIKYSESLRENYRNILFGLDLKDQPEAPKKIRELTDEQIAQNNATLFEVLAMKKRYGGV
ncbi:MAG: hypothetical protein BWZ03_00093 [bacterium ADurb.BinA186]|nr:MAG: hypothetical protein BWZ03_00093 [bacterium ADurb.BinA186]